MPSVSPSLFGREVWGRGYWKYSGMDRTRLAESSRRKGPTIIIGRGVNDSGSLRGMISKSEMVFSGRRFFLCQK